MEVVSVCASCRFADWRKTANGRRHPDGSGRCTFQVPDSPLPKWAVVWTRDSRTTATLRVAIDKQFPGRYIYWRKSRVSEPIACATWEAKD